MFNAFARYVTYLDLLGFFLCYMCVYPDDANNDAYTIATDKANMQYERCQAKWMVQLYILILYHPIYKQKIYITSYY